MSVGSHIEWTDATWNPVTGCSKVSQGCKHCYAETMTRRLQAIGTPKYRAGFKRVVEHPSALEDPLGWRRPRRVFVNSMSDLFHRDVSADFIGKVFRVMERARHHQFQVLTKRPQRAARMSPLLPWPANVWMGTSVENVLTMRRIDQLRGVGARVKFLSLEPLLGPLPDLDLFCVDWVIVGGESGPHARPMRADWVRDIRDQCQRERVPFFFKQWGGTRRVHAGRELDGRTWNEMPQAHSAANALLEPL